MISTGEKTSERYDEEYYRIGCGTIPYERSEHWLNFFALIADEIIRSLHPRRVLDAGCAKGFLVEALWDRGVYCEGVDISEYAISQVRTDIREYCFVGSIVTRAFGKFDLVTCIEVLEHLSPDLAKPAISNLCAAADTVLFSSTPSDFNEPTHLNVRPPIYWLQLFSELGFSPDARFDATFVAPHAMLLRKGPPADDDFLRLFSEYIRYKSALEAQAGKVRQFQQELTLSQQELTRSQADSAALLQAKTAELLQVQEESTRTKTELQSAKNDLAARIASDERVSSELEQVRSWLAASRRELAQGDKARQELIARIEASNGEVDQLQRRLVSETERLGRALVESNSELGSARSEASRLELERAAVQATLNAVLSSRAWRLAERCRIPLRKLRQDWPRLYRVLRFAGRRLLGSSLRSQSSRIQSNRVAPDQNSEADPSADVEKIQSEKLSQAAPPPSPVAIDLAYQRWIEEYEPGVKELARQRKLAQSLPEQPVFSVVVPVYRVQHYVLRACISSVFEQTYPHWHLCIAHAPGGDPENLEYLRHLAREEARVRLIELDENRGISRNSNCAIDLASGEFLVFLDHDDTLAPFALFELAFGLQNCPDLDLIYSDHDYLDAESGLRRDPLFKPDWSAEIMLSANYITHLTALRRTLAEQLGRFDPLTDGAQDWDLFLRAVEGTSRIAHIPKVLYHWRMHSESTARNDSAKSYAADAQLLALGRHMDRSGLKAAPEIMPDGLLHARFSRAPEGMISIIIPTKDRVDLLSRCISTLLDVTKHHHFEILVVDNASHEPDTQAYLRKLAENDRIQVIWYPGTFNYSAANNIGARAARGRFLLFLNNDVEITKPDWLTELAAWAASEPIGVVGAKLLRPSGVIQHAGVVVGMSGFADHPFADQPALTFGLAGSTGWYRNVLAVTGACMMLRREVFDQLGGFDESFQLCGSDVEFCLRACSRGYRVVYNPFAELIHHEQQTRGTDVPARDYVESLKHYGPWLLAGDPFWNPNLSLWSTQPTFRRRDEPTSLSFATHHVATLTNGSGSASTLQPRQPSEEELVVSWFNCSQEDFDFLRSHAKRTNGFRSVKRVLWFIPGVTNPFYGGIFTILRFAEFWRREKNVQNLFAICGLMDRDSAAAQIRLIYPQLRESDLFILGDREDAANLPAVGASICTLWTTAYYAVHHKPAVRRFYLIQDFEPAFYKAGSASAMVESTYRMGLYGIANTISLKQVYESEYGGKAMFFKPCIDSSIFNPSEFRKRRNPHGPWLVFFYGRPAHPRNSFELLTAAMKELKQALGNRVRIVGAGSEWNPAEYGLEGIVENLGTLTYEDSAKLYREADAGVVLMLTRHPSYIPLELMASGCLVITNLNSWTAWLLKDGQNCLLTCATATSIAETARRGLVDFELRERITAKALEMIRSEYFDWPSEMEKVYEYLCDPEAYLQRERHANETTSEGRPIPEPSLRIARAVRN